MKKDIQFYITVLVFLITLGTCAVGYGKVISKVDSLDQDFKIHCGNQLRSESIQSDNNKDLAVAVGKLTAQIDGLSKTIDKLNNKLER